MSYTKTDMHMVNTYCALIIREYIFYFLSPCNFCVENNSANFTADIDKFVQLCDILAS